MTIVEALDEVIKAHFGRSDFGLQVDHQYWAKMILNADLNDTMAFGRSHDAIAIEELRRAVRDVFQRIEKLSYATKQFKPKAHAAWLIREMIQGRKRDVFDEASLALSNLEHWLNGIADHRTFKRQATKKRNWRAASVVQACRIVWAAAKWEEQGRPLPQPFNALATWHLGAGAKTSVASEALRQEYSDFLIAFAPTSAKDAEPGPFGRFAEDIFQTLGILGKDGRPFPAASALRSRVQAGRQEEEN